jgi:hypothetical protein
MRLGTVLVPGLLGLGFFAAGATADCPLNSWISNPVVGSSTAPSFSFFSGSYNHVTGTFAASSSGGGEVGNSTSLSLADTYWLVGPSSATPIPLQARVHLTGAASASFELLPGGLQGCFNAGMTFELRHLTTTAQVTARATTSPCQSIVIDESVQLPLEKPPGEPFTLNFDLRVSNSTFQHANANGLLTFALPPGYSIASCQGFAGPTVPAAPSSWGRLKTAYR